MSVRRVTRRFPLRPVPSLDELSLVRKEFTAWSATVIGARDRVEDLSVVVSELGANAVEATPPGREPPTLRAWVAGSVLVIEVANRVDAASDTVEWDLEDPLRAGGRGLLLISAFVDDVHVDVEDDLLLVRCVTTL